MPTKREIRKIHIDKRNSFSEDYVIGATKEINSRLIETLKNYINTDSVVALYSAMKNEINLDDTITNLSNNKTMLALPWISYNDKIMQFKLWHKNEALSRTADFYCPQPEASAKTVTPSIIVAPLVTCDIKGNRIGYGKGYYDKYINQHYQEHPLIIGLCYDKNIYTETIPHEPHDCKLRILISEKKLLITDTSAFQRKAF